MDTESQERQHPRGLPINFPSREGGPSGGKGPSGAGSVRATSWIFHTGGRGSNIKIPLVSLMEKVT